MSFEINKSVKWVGKIDWELKKFHGDEYSTHRGSSYNSYLVRDEKIAIIDTVWTPLAKTNKRKEPPVWLTPLCITLFNYIRNFQVKFC